MAVGDDVMTEGPISPLLLNSVVSYQESGSLSPEDVAWVDSCLLKDPEVSESDCDWDSLKDALLEILSVQPHSIDKPEGGSEVFPSRADMEILPSNDNTGDALLPSTDDYPIPINEAEESSDDISDNQRVHKFRSVTNLESVFLPSYNEEQQRETESTNFNSLGDGVDLSTDDIFKVWDLEIPAVEDELIRQLNKVLTDNSTALADSSSPTTPASFDDLGKWKDSEGELLDDLVSSIVDLSLDKRTG